MAAPTEAPASNATTFEDLPGEIRNIIYGLALVRQHSIKISRHRPENVRPHIWNATAFQNREYELKVTMIGFKGKQKRRVAPNEVATLSLLRVSKAVSHEASSIFFGDNAFIFETAPALEHFLNIIGKRAAYLRDVEVKEHLFSKRNYEQVARLSIMADPKRIVVARRTHNIRS